MLNVMKDLSHKKLLPFRGELGGGEGVGGGGWGGGGGVPGTVRSATRREGNVLINVALNTFYLRLYGVRHMVKVHSDSERENPLPPHGLLFFD